MHSNLSLYALGYSLYVYVVTSFYAAVRLITYSWSIGWASGPDYSARSLDRLARELVTLAWLPDDRIDTSEAPEVRDSTGARRGLLYRPLKRQLTLRLDADVVDWFKRQAKGGRGYQTDINRALREHVRRRDKRAVG